MNVLQNQHLQRVVSNYIRMAIGLVIGILIVRSLLRHGEGVYSVFALTASSIGIAEILKEAVRGASIPELGISYHSRDEDRFRSSYASAMLLSMIAGFFAVLVLAAFIACLDFFSIDPGLRRATTIFIATRMVSVFAAVALSPTINMLPITGRMVTYNFWLSVDRIAEFSALVAAERMTASGNQASLLENFGYLSMLTMTASTMLAALHASQCTSIFKPDLVHLDLRRTTQVLSSVGWSGAATLSVSLYLRFDMFAVNYFYGTFGTVIFGVASQLAGYLRQVTMGVITGLDSVVTKKAADPNGNGRSQILQINIYTFELQALSLFAAGVILLLHADTIFGLVFGDRLPDAGNQVPLIAQTFLFLMAGMIARGLSDGWMLILGGAGRIRDYARPVLIGALLNPILVVMLSLWLDPRPGLIGTSVIFLILNVVFHMIVVPQATAAYLGVGVLRLIAPGLAPFLAAFLCVLVSYGTDTLLSGAVHKLVLTSLLTGAVFGPWILSKFKSFMALR